MMRTYQLEEAKRMAKQFADNGDQSWYVVQVGEDYTVVPKSELNTWRDNGTVIYGAEPGKATTAP